MTDVPDFEKVIVDHYRRAGHWEGILEGCDALVAGDRPAKVAVVISGISSGVRGSRIHLYAMGKSQGGKSWTQRRIGEHLFPNFEPVNSSSAKAPYYKAKDDPKCFEGKIRMYDEFADQSEEFQNQVKAFTSPGVDSAKLESVDMKREFMEADIVGLPVVWTNSALPIDSPGAEQILNRFFKINIDESPNQDSVVQEWQRHEEMHGNWVDRERDAIDSARRQIVVTLDKRNYEILNPFAEFWNVRCPSNRNFRPMITNIVRTFSYSNRVLRTHIGKSRILASLSDNLIGFTLWSKFEAYQLKKVPARYLKLLNALNPDQPYTKKEMSDAYSEKYPGEMKLGPDTCYQYAHTLEKMGLMGSEYREHSKELEFYSLASVEASSHPQYGKDGTLTGLVFESLELKIPTIEELASAIERMRISSLTSWETTESPIEIAETLLDFNYALRLAEVLDLPLPALSGQPSTTSNTRLVDYIRDDSLDIRVSKALEERES